MTHIADPFFLAGFAALLFVFATCAFVGLSLFRVGAARHNMLLWQSATLFVQVCFLAGLAFTLWGQLDAMRHFPEPTVADLEVWTRRTFSVLLLGITTVFSSLLTAFGWVRTGSIGNAMRSVIWAIPGVKTVISAVVVSGLLYRASLSPGKEEAIAIGSLPETASSILQPLTAVGTVWVPVCLGMFAVSAILSFGQRRENSADSTSSKKST